MHKPHFRSRVRKRLAQFQNNRVIPKGERAAVEGRRHRDMQTDKWLEEIKDRVPEVEIGVQGGRANATFHDKSIIPEMYMMEIRILSYFICQLN